MQRYITASPDSRARSKVGPATYFQTCSSVSGATLQNVDEVQLPLIVFKLYVSRSLAIRLRESASIHGQIPAFLQPFFIFFHVLSALFTTQNAQPKYLMNKPHA